MNRVYRRLKTTKRVYTVGLELMTVYISLAQIIKMTNMKKMCSFLKLLIDFLFHVNDFDFHFYLLNSPERFSNSYR